VYNIITGKMAQKYQGSDIDAMKAVANAHKNRSLSEFQKSLEDYKKGTHSPKGY
jgi:26S proteasome regulatory subunit N6